MDFSLTLGSKGNAADQHPVTGVLLKYTKTVWVLVYTEVLGFLLLKRHPM